MVTGSRGFRFRKLLRINEKILTGTRWHFVGPGAIAHAENHGMSASDVARLTFESDYRPVAATASVEDGDVRMGSFREWRTLRGCTKV